MKTETHLNFQESEKQKARARLPGSLSANCQQHNTRVHYTEFLQSDQQVNALNRCLAVANGLPIKSSVIGVFMTSNNTTEGLRYTSGLGMYHSNEAEAKYPKPYTDISMAEIARMALNPQQVQKEKAQWAIPSTLKSRSFEVQESQGEYGFMWADFDKNPQPISAIVGFWEDTIGCKAVAYSSRSATVDKQKSRLIVPIAEVLTFEQWTMAQECMADMLTEKGFAADYAACRSAQLCYLPNRGEFYDAYLCTTGGNFDPMDYFADRIVEKVREIERQKAVLEDQRKRAIENRKAFASAGNESAIEYFNATRTVQDVLIEAGYSQRGDKFRHPNSESGSYSASVQNGRVFSLGETDPLFTGGSGGRAHDAFGAWSVLFFGGDAGKAARAVYLEMKEAA